MRTNLRRTIRINRMSSDLALAMLIAMVPLAISASGQKPSQESKAATAKLWTPPRTADGQPDLEGVWSNASIIPLERPKELEGKQFFTRQELLAYEERVFNRSIRDKPPAPGSVGTYNDFWW